MIRMTHIHPHPDKPGEYIIGNKYTYVPAGGRYLRFTNYLGLTWIKDKAQPGGVWIGLLCGTRIFRPNSFYSHIEGMEPGPNDIFPGDSYDGVKEKRND